MGRRNWAFAWAIMGYMIAGVINTPAVAVIIPTHNREDLLRKVLDSVFAQTVPAEVYVMDDASTDGTEAMVRRDFPRVHYHREETNHGPTFQRNKGAELTQAEVLFTIDDDCVLSSPQILQQTLEAFDHPRVGAVTMPFVNILKDNVVRTRAEKNGSVMVTFEYYGGMIAFRREAFAAAGGYRAILFMHVEESDLSIRLLENGYVVRLGWSDPIDHFESASRNQARLFSIGGRNHVLYAFYNVPWPYFGWHLAGTTVNNLLDARRKNVLIPVSRGICSAYATMFRQFFRRKPVSGTTYRLSRLLKARDSISLDEIESMLPAMKHPAVT
jgi:glycosyltransferase involved in cell wall biosynthesis